MENLERLKELILETTEDNINNKKLLKALREEFIRKNLPATIPNQLFSDAIDDDHLEKNCLIAIAKIFKRELNDDRFKLTKYFTEGELFNYENELKIEELKVDHILLKGVKQIDKKNYLGTITGDMAVTMRKNGLYSYYKMFQRAPKLVKTSSGRTIQKIDININNILDMEEGFIKGNITPTAIHFGILVKNDKGIVENFKFKKMYENIGDMWIKPDFDFDSETYLPLISVDGWHRLNALCNAVEKMQLEGKHIDVELGCFIHIFDNDADAKKFVVDSFKRCSTNLDYLNAMQPTEENAFISNFEKESKWLNNRVATTKQEMRVEKNITEQRILIEAFKKTNIEMNDSISNEMAREKIANIVDSILDFTLEELYCNNKEAMRKGIFLNKNIFKLYIKFASEVRGRKYNKDIYNLVHYINDYSEDILEVLNHITDEKIEKILGEVIQ